MGNITSLINNDEDIRVSINFLDTIKELMAHDSVTPALKSLFLQHMHTNIEQFYDDDNIQPTCSFTTTKRYNYFGSCKTCDIDALCINCFFQGGHKSHFYTFSMFNNKSCNCGKIKNPKHNCIKHKNAAAVAAGTAQIPYPNVKQDVRYELTEIKEIERDLHVFFNYLVSYIHVLILRFKNDGDYYGRYIRYKIVDIVEFLNECAKKSIVLARIIGEEMTQVYFFGQPESFQDNFVIFCNILKNRIPNVLESSSLIIPLDPFFYDIRNFRNPLGFLKSLYITLIKRQPHFAYILIANEAVNFIGEFEQRTPSAIIDCLFENEQVVTKLLKERKTLVSSILDKAADYVATESDRDQIVVSLPNLHTLIKNSETAKLFFDNSIKSLSKLMENLMRIEEITSSSRVHNITMKFGFISSAVLRIISKLKKYLTNPIDISVLLTYIPHSDQIEKGTVFLMDYQAMAIMAANANSIWLKNLNYARQIAETLLLGISINTMDECHSKRKGIQPLGDISQDSNMLVLKIATYVGLPIQILKAFFENNNNKTLAYNPLLALRLFIAVLQFSPSNDLDEPHTKYHLAQLIGNGFDHLVNMQDLCAKETLFKGQDPSKLQSMMNSMKCLNSKRVKGSSSFYMDPYYCSWSNEFLFYDEKKQFANNLYLNGAYERPDIEFPNIAIQMDEKLSLEIPLRLHLIHDKIFYQLIFRELIAGFLQFSLESSPFSFPTFYKSNNADFKKYNITVQEDMLYLLCYSLNKFQDTDLAATKLKLSKYHQMRQEKKLAKDIFGEKEINPITGIFYFFRGTSGNIAFNTNIFDQLLKLSNEITEKKTQSTSILNLLNYIADKLIEIEPLFKPLFQSLKNFK